MLAKRIPDRALTFPPERRANSQYCFGFTVFAGRATFCRSPFHYKPF
jgi:hypothetical protein